MRPIRRTDHSPRVEMTPMIDIIFLLLTFFIYSLVMMVRADVLPVRLAPLGTGARAQSAANLAVTIDKAGRVFFGREVVRLDDLDQRLAALAREPAPPVLYLAVEAEGEVDRGPLLMQVIEKVRQAGLKDFVLVGQPSEGRAATP